MNWNLEIDIIACPNWYWKYIGMHVLLNEYVRTPSCFHFYSERIENITNQWLKLW